jgi:hypothetical protein
MVDVRIPGFAADVRHGVKRDGGSSGRPHPQACDCAETQECCALHAPIRRRRGAPDPAAII